MRSLLLFSYMFIVDLEFEEGYGGKIETNGAKSYKTFHRSLAVCCGCSFDDQLKLGSFAVGCFSSGNDAPYGRYYGSGMYSCRNNFGDLRRGTGREIRLGNPMQYVVYWTIYGFDNA